VLASFAVDGLLAALAHAHTVSLSHPFQSLFPFRPQFIDASRVSLRQSGAIQNGDSRRDDLNVWTIQIGAEGFHNVFSSYHYSLHSLSIVHGQAQNVCHGALVGGE
jgi:hypothetical protein